jgi:hypothetical protein
MVRFAPSVANGEPRLTRLTDWFTPVQDGLSGAKCFQRLRHEFGDLVIGCAGYLS